MRHRGRSHRIRKQHDGVRSRRAERPAVRFAGGTGLTVEEAVVIRGARYYLEGTAAEFKWLEEHFGRKDADWSLRTEYHRVIDGRGIDAFELQAADGTPHKVYFECTPSFGLYPDDL